MDPKTLDTKVIYYRKWCAVMGACIVLLPLNFTNMWGNFSVYVLSYFYSRHNLTSELLTPWVMSTYFICVNVALLIGGRLKCLNRNVLIFLGILLFNIGMSTCYFALEYVSTRLLFTGVVIVGLSVGILHSHVFKSVADCSNSESRPLLSIASSGISFGPCVINPLVTVYVNPDNTPPDVTVEGIEVFSQHKVVEKVPSMFLMLGAMNFVLQTIGFVMLLQTPKGRDSYQETNDIYGSVLTQHEVTNERKNEPSNESTNGKTNVVAMDIQDDTTKRRGLAKSAGLKEQKDFEPLQTLRQIVFYILWLSFAFAMFADLFLFNFYKTFGMTKIADDHFLASLGSVIGVAGGIARISWGFALDRYGIKRCMVFLYSSIGNVLLVMYFTPLLDKWLYFITTAILGSLLACVYPGFVTATSSMFGLKHFNDNLGLMCTAPLLIGFVAPPVFNYLMVNVGWFAIFDLSALAVVIALVIIVAKLPSI